MGRPLIESFFSMDGATMSALGEIPRGKHLPPITEAQAEALDTLHFLGERFSVSTNFEKGDMQYVNNVAIFHARDGFTDIKDKQ